MFQNTGFCAANENKSWRRKGTNGTNKFNEAAAKENSKENVIYSYKLSENSQKLPVNDKFGSRSQTGERNEEHPKSGDLSDALKPITNLPKSKDKDPFETFSDLCDGSVGLRNRKKPNLKKQRVKDDKPINVSKGRKQFHYSYCSR